MQDCPEHKKSCPCQEFSKEGLCDWPYSIDLDHKQIRYLSELLKVIEKSDPGLLRQGKR